MKHLETLYQSFNDNTFTLSCGEFKKKEKIKQVALKKTHKSEERQTISTFLTSIFFKKSFGIACDCSSD